MRIEKNPLFRNLALITFVALAIISTALIYSHHNCSTHSIGSSRTRAARSRHMHTYTPKTLTPVVSDKFSKCPPLKSTAVRFANERKFSLRENSETAIGNGLLAASCKSQGFDYTLVLPYFDNRAMDWYSQAFNAIVGEGPAPLCGYGWDHNLHVFKNDPCALIVDIGANVGLSMCPYLSRNYRVLAFEPIRANLEMLRTNVWINGWDIESVGIVSAGVSNYSGQATIFMPLGNEDNSALGSANVATLNVQHSDVSMMKIDLISMDDYFDSADSSLIDTVQLFKIDAQGHELPILQGMKKILSSGARRFALFVEVSDTLQLAAGHDPKDIEKYMLNLGWKPFCSRGNMLEPGSSCDDVIFLHESRMAEAQVAFP
jgi:FkbM family methyltransferase